MARYRSFAPSTGAFVGRKGSTSILPALHLLRHAMRSCCQRIKYAHCYHTRRKRKIRTLLQSETGSDFSCLVGAGGFEPPKLKSSRFTVCPHWPLGNTPKFCSRPLPDDSFILSDKSGFVNYFSEFFVKKEIPRRRAGSFSAAAQDFKKADLTVQGASGARIPSARR